MSKNPAKASRHSTWNQSFSDRATLPNTSTLAAYLYRLMVRKSTNLCLSADVQSTAELLDVAEECGDSICVLKTHADIVSDFSERTIRGLAEIAARKKFLVFEDRKFGDIGSTVQAQYVAGPYRIASWANIVNAHIFPGPAIITALKSAASSAVAAYNTSRSTEISGGDGSHSDSRPHADSLSEDISDDEEDDDDDEDSEDDDEEEEEQSEQDPIPRHREQHSYGSEPMDIPLRPDIYQRKPSVISINTTISSSTEIVSSPYDLSNSSLSFKDRPPLSRGLLLLAQMSSEDNLFTEPYTKKCVELARQHADFVMGFIAQKSLNRDPGDNFIVMTPGINMPPASATAGKSRSVQDRSAAKSSKPPSKASTAKNLAPPKSNAAAAAAAATEKQAAKGDGLGQQYNSPRYVILEQGVDVIIVGRGILNADDRKAEAERYQAEGWAAIRERTRT